MEFRILGPVGVGAGTGLVDSGADTVELGGPQRRLLLALLLARAGTVTSADALTVGLWGEHPPPSATAVLHAQVSRLRSALEPDRAARRPATVLRSLGSGYVLDLSGHDCDADTFSASATAAGAALDAGDPAAAAALLQGALDLWRGPVFGEFTDHPLLGATRDELEERRLGAVETLFEARLALGEHTAVVGPLVAAVAEHPFREQLWAQLMLALYRGGRQAEALEAFQRCRRQLIAELGIEPGPRLQSLDEAILLQKPELDRQPVAERVPAAVHAPPAPRSTFIGRAAELDAGDAALAGRRAVVVTGTGGVGKTRFTLELVARVRERFHHGVAFCDVSGLTDPDLVEATVVGAVGAQDTPRAARGRLVTHLAGRKLLLVIDNADRVGPAVAALSAELLAACSGVCVIVTSREPVGVAGAQLVRLEPLDVRPDGDAVRLLRDRAALADPDAVLDAPNDAALCRRLDGLPLAIELAAGRLRSIPLPDLLAGLDERLSSLRGERLPAGTGTLGDVLSWSIEQLAAGQQALLRRLAVFAGGFSAAAAARVCEVLDPAEALADLVDRSLVHLRYVDGEPRYRLLETVRADGLDRLARHGELDEHRSRHLVWCRSLAIDTTDVRLREDPGAVAGLAGEMDNVVAALAWGLEHDPRQASELAVVAAAWWVHAGRAQEAVRWLRRAADREPAVALPALGWALTRQGEFRDARQVLGAALQVEGVDRDDVVLQLAVVEIDSGDVAAGAARLAALPPPSGSGAERDTAGRRLALGRRALQIGEQAEAAQQLDSAAVAARRARMWFSLTKALGALAQVESARGHRERAEGAIAEALAVARRHGLVSAMPRLLGAAALLAYRGDDHDRAAAHFHEALSAARHAGDPHAEMVTLTNLASMKTNAGESVEAVQLSEQALAVAERLDDERTTLMIMTNLAEAVLDAYHDTARALDLAAEAIGRATRAGLRIALTFAVESAAYALIQRAGPGDAERAARCLGAAAAERRELGRVQVGGELEPVERAMAQLGAALGAAELDAAMERGRGAGIDVLAKELVAHI